MPVEKLMYWPERNATSRDVPTSGWWYLVYDQTDGQRVEECWVPLGPNMDAYRAAQAARPIAEGRPRYRALGVSWPQAPRIVYVEDLHPADRVFTA